MSYGLNTNGRWDGLSRKLQINIDIQYWDIDELSFQVKSKFILKAYCPISHPFVGITNESKLGSTEVLVEA